MNIGPVPSELINTQQQHITTKLMTQVVRDLYSELNQLQLEINTITRTNDQLLATLKVALPTATQDHCIAKLLDTPYHKNLQKTLLTLMEIKLLIDSLTNRIRKSKNSNGTC